MGYLLTKKADVVPDKTSLGVPYLKPTDSESGGNMLAGLIAGSGLAGTTAIGNSLFKKKLLNDAAYAGDVLMSELKMMDKMNKSKNSVAQWMLKNLTKPVPGSADVAPTLLGKGMHLAHGFKNLKFPGKLKALGLVAAPLAAGGLIDAAID